MKKIANILVEKRIVILIFFVIFTVASIWMMTKVKLNSDMTQYLPDDSSTKKGTEIMLDEFPAGSSFNIMFKHLSDIERLAIRSGLEAIPYVRSVSYEPGSDLYNQDSYTLYTVNLSVNAYTPAVEAVTDTIKNEFKGYDITMSGDALGNSSKDIIPKLAVIAFVILMIILFIMCSSWVEPFLFLATIAIAIVINMGTNIIFPNVSEVTNSISAVLQLVLSMDYSIMLLNRYRQEKEKTADKFEAMKMALAGAATSISSSSVTTVVGMLALCFMSFKIGSDMGLVLAKGVLLSLICIFTVLTALILIFDKAIERTAKPAFHIKMDAIGKFSFWARKAIPVFFVLLFIGAFFLRGKVGIAYTMSDYYEINKIFSPKNNIVVLYDNADEDKIATLAQDWEENAVIDTVNAYSTTLGREMTYDEMAEAADMETSMVAQMYNSYFAYHQEVGTSTAPEKIVLTDFLQFLQTNVAANPQYAELLPSDMAQQLVTSMQQIPQQMMAQEMTAAEMATTLQMDFPIVEQLYSFYAISKGDMPQGKIAIYDFMQFIIDDVSQDKALSSYFTNDILAQLEEVRGEMDDGLKSLVGANLSRAIITVNLPEESKDTFAFIDNLQMELDDKLSGEHHIVGSSAMANEMSKTFPKEMDFITILTAAAIFLVVAIAFRSISIPFILVCIIQCAVFITMGASALGGRNIYFLPLLIVECLLMGATVDYGILYTSYYREARRTLCIKESVISALNHSIHTILTSALILITITGVLGFMLASAEPAISSILKTIAIGALCATLLVIFVFPGILVAFDKMVIGRKKVKKEKESSQLNSAQNDDGC